MLQIANCLLFTQYSFSGISQTTGITHVISTCVFISLKPMQEPQTVLNDQ